MKKLLVAALAGALFAPLGAVAAEKSPIFGNAKPIIMTQDQSKAVKGKGTDSLYYAYYGNYYAYYAYYYGSLSYQNDGNGYSAAYTYYSAASSYAYNAYLYYYYAYYYKYYNG